MHRSPLPLRLYTANVVCAVITGLCVALPITGAAFLVALVAGCLAEAGCASPTFLDQLVPVVFAITWATTAVHAGVLQFRTLHRTIGLRPTLRVRIR